MEQSASRLPTAEAKGRGRPPEGRRHERSLLHAIWANIGEYPHPTLVFGYSSTNSRLATRAATVPRFPMCHPGILWPPLACLTWRRSDIGITLGCDKPRLPRGGWLVRRDGSWELREGRRFVKPLVAASPACESRVRPCGRGPNHRLPSCRALPCFVASLMAGDLASLCQAAFRQV